MAAAVCKLTWCCVVLSVVLEVVEVGEWAESVTLPFTTSAALPQDAAVEWRRSEPKTMVMYVYEGGREQPEQQEEYYRGRTKMNDNPLRSGDLSVTMYNSGYSDRGTYVCTVHRDGHILTQKTVLYQVKGQWLRGHCSSYHHHHHHHCCCLTLLSVVLSVSKVKEQSATAELLEEAAVESL